MRKGTTIEHNSKPSLASIQGTTAIREQYTGNESSYVMSQPYYFKHIFVKI